MSDAILYIPGLNNRIAYAVAEALDRRSGIYPKITQDESEYLASDMSLKIHYTQRDLPGYRLYRSGFLDETGIKQGFVPSFAHVNNVFCLFVDAQQQEFDLLAMVFWCLTRYEEYQPFTPDKHGRFPAAASWLKKWNVLEEPICDLAIQATLKTWGLTPKPKFTVTPTLDIDIAFAYAGRTFLRSLGSTLKNPLSLPQRLKSIAHPESDPNYSFPYIQSALQNHPEARVFWHCGADNNPYDKQVSLDYLPLLQAMKNMDNGTRCGLHPSFAACTDSTILLKEKQFLEQTLNRQITDSRMHYILLSFPRTYRSLLHAGITHDYSMGYPDANGFRAGTAYPFHWYDLEAEKATQLQIHPFCMMEATCKYYAAQTPEQAMDTGLRLKAAVQNTGGDFGFIFHNESLGSQAGWRGWKKVFEAWIA